MKNSLKAGAALALALVLAAALLGASALTGTFDNTIKGIIGDDSSADPSSEEDGLTDQNGGSQAADTPANVRLVIANYTQEVVEGSLGSFELWVCVLDSPYAGDLILEVDVTPSAGEIIGPTSGGTPGFYTFSISFPQTGEFCVKVTPYDLDCNLIGDPVEVPVNVVAAPNGGENGGGDNETTSVVNLNLVFDLPFVLAGSNELLFVISATNISDGGPYTGDLVLQVDVTPSGHGSINYTTTWWPGEFRFEGNFEPGDYLVTVTPYDSEGNVIGDAFESTVRAVPEGTIAMTDYGTREVSDNQTVFFMWLRLYSEVNHAGAGFNVTKIVLDIDGQTYERAGGMSYARNNAAEVSILLPTSAYPPGAQYTITVYDGDRVLGTATGIAPG